jgi:hypothetical protein
MIELKWLRSKDLSNWGRNRKRSIIKRFQRYSEEAFQVIMPMINFSGSTDVRFPPSFCRSTPIFAVLKAAGPRRSTKPERRAASGEANEPGNGGFVSVCGSGNHALGVTQTSTGAMNLPGAGLPT